MHDQPPDLYSTAEAAKRLMLSQSSVQRLIREGVIETVLARSKVRISAAQLAAYVRTLEREHTQRVTRRRGRPPLSLAQRLGRDAQQQGVG